MGEALPWSEQPRRAVVEYWFSSVNTRSKSKCSQGIFEGEVGNRFGQELPLAGDSGEHRGHGIPDLRDDPEELQDEATAHHEGQNHWRDALAG